VNGFLFVVLLRELQSVLTCKLQIAQETENSNPFGSAIEGGDLFERFVFGDRVSSISSADCALFTSLLTLTENELEPL
jgi:hypothetical protein